MNPPLPSALGLHAAWHRLLCQVAFQDPRPNHGHLVALHVATHCLRRRGALRRGRSQCRPARTGVLGTGFTEREHDHCRDVCVPGL